MICKRLKDAIPQHCTEMEEAMYNYGLECAKKKKINFRKVSDTFDILKFATEERDSNMKIIIRGFCRGLSTANV
jgi:hypothetical protein